MQVKRVPWYPLLLISNSMKQYILSALLVLSTSVYAADMILPIRSITDGDTIRSTVKLPCPLCNVSIRIIGIDTPESTWRAKCQKEKELGLQAKAFVISLTQNQTSMIARNVRWDKYGGRILAHVEIDGKDVGQQLIARGLAKPYTGIGPKSDWCN